MTYRDDRDADRARIEALEAELADAKRQVAELEGRREQALVLASGGALAPTARPTASTRWLGAPIELALTREFDRPFPVDRFEELVEPCRAITRDVGRTELLKTSMTWASGASPKSIGPFLVVTVSVRDGKTRLAVSDRLGQAAGAIYGGIGGGVGGGTIALPIAAGVALGPVVIPALVISWLGATYWGCRAMYRRVARKRARLLEQVFDALVRDIEAALPPP